MKADDIELEHKMEKFIALCGHTVGEETYDNPVLSGLIKKRVESNPCQSCLAGETIPLNCEMQDVPASCGHTYSVPKTEQSPDCDPTMKWRDYLRTRPPHYVVFACGCYRTTEGEDAVINRICKECEKKNKKQNALQNYWRAVNDPEREVYQHDEIVPGNYYCYSGNEKYFARITLQAYEAENHLPQPYYFYYGLRRNGKLYVQNFNCGYERVGRRIEFRLGNNHWIEKINPMTVIWWRIKNEKIRSKR